MTDETFFFSGYNKSALKKVIHSAGEETGLDALVFNITYNQKDYEVPIIFSPEQVAEYHEVLLDKVPVQIAYGKVPIELPFSLFLNDFILERYAGSESPSSYASEVTVLDKRSDTRLNHRIFMNNVLDYDSFRFFQSSYDQDEKGTILSVNHDFWGTLISYIGYGLLTLGFIITLLNKKSRFLTLRHNIAIIRKSRKSITAIVGLIIGFAFSANAQNDSLGIVSEQHAEHFGHLITQTIDGRFEPINSLAYDALHKISRKDKFVFEGRGEFNDMQAFMDRIFHPEFWKKQEMIYIK